MVARIGSQHRRESTRSTKDLTEESSSWSGDDVCANCGASARPNHLYCSQECKDEDAEQLNSSGKLARALNSAPSHSHHGSSSITMTSDAPFWADPNQHSDNTTKFRYACPTSPNIVAKYNSALTSPALVALERSLPNAASTLTTTTMTTTKAKDSRSISSSGDSNGIAQAKSSKCRSSSRSTFSSASDVVSTEQSTPQSMSEAVQDEEDEDCLNASDFHLPPSVRPSSIMLSSTATGRTDSPIVTSSTSVNIDGFNCSPISKITLNSTQSNHPGKTSVKTDTIRNTLDFARRPSTTNLPPMLPFTSPMMKPINVNKNGETTQRKTDRLSQASSHDAQATLRGRKSTSGKSIPSYAIWEAAKGSKDDEIVSKLDVPLQHTRGATDDSFSNLTSASSSADKTLRALSPLDGAVSTFSTNICGRYGCSGLGNSVESPKQNITDGSLSSRRPSMTFGHKHTHSAAAGLNLYGQDQPLKLLMTPVAAESKQGESQERQDPVFEDHIRHPPRGRSKARGRRSASHRSPSPARGAARRGQSEDLSINEADQDVLPPTSPTSSRSQPMAFPLGRRSPIEHDNKDADEILQHRGRSLTEREVPLQALKSRRGNKTTSTMTSECNLDDSCEMAWPGYGHDLYSQGGDSKVDVAHKIASALLHGSKGYDDVDLDEL